LPLTHGPNWTPPDRYQPPSRRKAAPRPPVSPRPPKRAPSTPYPGYKSDQELLAAARDMAAQSQAGSRAQLGSQRAQTLATAQQNAQLQQQISSALAQVLTGLAPQIYGLYKDAANTQASYGKGFSNDQLKQTSASADDINAALSSIGAPEGQNVDSGTAASDVLYATGGTIPAESFLGQGAGFAAAAQAYPMMAVQQGIQLAARILGQGQSQVGDIDSQLAKLAADLPAAEQDYLGQLETQQSRLADQSFKQQQADWQRKYQLANLNQRVQYQTQLLKLRQAGAIDDAEYKRQSLLLRQAQMKDMSSYRQTLLELKKAHSPAATRAAHVAKEKKSVPESRPPDPREGDGCATLPSSASSSANHMQAYCDEFAFRFNSRENPYLFRDTLRLIKSDSLPYAKLTA
jgi:hypothetical protein